MRMFTVAAYNIEGGVGVTKGYGSYLRHGWKHFLPNVSEKIHQIGKFFDDHGVDIAIISEIDDMSLRTKWVSQAQILSKHSELHHFKFFPTFIFKPFFHGGNAILSRYPMVAAETIKLPSGRWSRYINKATILMDHQEVEVYVTHLSLAKKHRDLQIREIANMLSKVKNPVILGGDFNTMEDGEEIKPLKSIGLRSGDTQFTYPSWKPKMKLDYVMGNKQVHIVSGYVSSQAIFSDHLPVMAECELITY